MSNNIVSKILILDYIIAFIVVMVVTVTGTTETFLTNAYGVLFLGLIPVVGGINGLYIAKRWGSFKSAVGKAVIFLSLGLISWGLGTYVWSGFYNLILGIDVPYPSLADVGYILALPLWIAGMIQLSRATGAKYGLRSTGGKMILWLIPIVIVALSYYLLVTVARGGVLDLSGSGALTIFFDLAYPIGDILILALATLVYGLSYNFFGGKYKKSIYVILFGFVIMYFADFLFSYTTTVETFYSANWVDLLFTTAMFVLSMGVTMLNPKKSKDE